MAPSTSTKTTALLRLARRGPVRARDMDDEGIPRAYLKRLCDRGVLDQVGRGLYRLADAPMSELGSLADVSKRVPNAVCSRGKTKQRVPLLDLPLPSPSPAGADWIAAFRRWARDGR